jgi:ribosome recycling factor
MILVPIPALTGERRRELTKVVRRDGESAKVSIRNGRRDALDMLEMLDDISEDEVHRSRKKVQDLVDVASKRVDAVMAEKEKEILEGP